MSMKSILNNLEKHGIDVTGVAETIDSDAFYAAAATGAASLLPAAAIPAAIIASTAAVWHMYIKLALRLGIRWDKGVLRTLATAAVSNLVINLGGLLVGDFFLSLVPGASFMVGTVVTYYAVYIAGMMFLTMLGKLMNRYGSLSELENLDSEALTDCIDCSRAYVKDALKDAKASRNA